MTYRHLPHIEVKGVFSDCRQFRYLLTLKNLHRKPGKTVCVIMQNPSVADEDIADKSVQFLEKLIFEKELPEFREVNQCIIVNQFARIQTRDFEGKKEDIGKQNDIYLERAIRDADIVLLAWGKRNPFSERQQMSHNMLKKFGKKEILMTRKHPSRGRYTDFIEPFEIH
ncbi:DUF1643 domain-containing protein [Muriicola sp. E247]|uniref:DUF1643 domain-containing protein n=1 Tax=Muriicola sp. E247 TaxID=3242730 RepID=UPI0035248D81